MREAPARPFGVVSNSYIFHRSGLRHGPPSGPSTMITLELEGSSWHPSDEIATFHGKKGLACAADGHVDKFTPQEASDPTHSLALFE